MIVVPNPAPPTLPYAIAARILDDLPTTVAAERARRGLSVKDAAAAIGVAATTLTGLEAGSNCTRATAAAALRWLGA